VNSPVRYLPRPAEFPRLTTAELRDSFLLAELFAPGEFRLTLTETDRMAIGGVVPLEPMALPVVAAFGTSYFTERRELGVFNIGAPGVVTVDGAHFEVNRYDCLYIGCGHREVIFKPAEDGLTEFYLVSCPAHQSFPAKLVRLADVHSQQLGDEGHANRRRLRRYIHADGAASCQLVMGMTELEPGGVWNTMPPHTHGRRSEAYLYFDMPPNEAVFHFLGKPTETRHLIVRDREAVISPPWSVHTGVGTAPYRFVWAMAGENQDFEDMDAAPIAQML
jgi:4-deoxy-L-threo-5-hexosulose-uronate ketol-isomerase